MPRPITRQVRAERRQAAEVRNAIWAASAPSLKEWLVNNMPGQAKRQRAKLEML